MDVVVFGAGSLGTLIGGLLAREHAVTLVGRDPHARRVRERGLRIGGRVDASVRPDAVADGTGLAADLAVVTVKAGDTAAAAEALATGEYGAALSLQNGLTEEALAARLDAPVLAGTATYGARLRAPGRVACTGVGRVVLGARGGGPSALADRIGAAFAAAGIEARVSESMPRRRWEKLAVNAGVNPVTALARVENGALADGPAATLARRAAAETARVARAGGIDLSEADATDALAEVVAATADNRSSMLQDVDAGRRTEIDAISGAVAERAAERGVDAPVNRALAALVRAWEVERGLR